MVRSRTSIVHRWFVDGSVCLWFSLFNSVRWWAYLFDLVSARFVKIYEIDTEPASAILT